MNHPQLSGADVAAATLLGLPEMTPARLRTVLGPTRDPCRALAAVRAGRAPVAPREIEEGAAPADSLPRLAGVATREELRRRWAAAADPDRAGALLARRGTWVLRAEVPGYPIDEPLPDRPPILLAEGSPDTFDAPRVAVVGTRAATPHGLADARELGAFLAEHGVTVVSGLAIGIDGAVHEGALDAGGAVAGVVATGLDIVYPRRHARLFDRVRSRGVIVTENPFGTPPEPFRFPVRNRIIAALGDVTVVIEARATGGARITAHAALGYGRSVLALPGSRRNPAAAGCNTLLAEGAQALVDWSDVLVALSLTPGARRGAGIGAAELTAAPTSPRRSRSTPPGRDTARVWKALAGEPADPDALAGLTGLDPPAVALAVYELARSGWVTRARGLVWPL